MAKDPEDLAKKIMEVGLSVRQAEELAKGITPASAPQNAAPNVADIAAAISGTKAGQSAPRQSSGGSKSEDVLQLEQMLADNLGLRVSITTRGAQAGEVVIGYDTLTQLDEILRRLGGSI
jgi:ParB family chromosome partitioning protein